MKNATQGPKRRKPKESRPAKKADRDALILRQEMKKAQRAKGKRDYAEVIARQNAELLERECQAELASQTPAGTNPGGA